jgi:metal-responsive CopG/Arc/MetJ family transcriptional regulator
VAQRFQQASPNDPSEDILRYICLVRVKTSITLPADLLGQLDRVDKNRSALLERAARAYLAQLESEKRDRRDLEIINRNADRLNREAVDTLEYQRVP